MRPRRNPPFSAIFLGLFLACGRSDSRIQSVAAPALSSQPTIRTLGLDGAAIDSTLAHAEGVGAVHHHWRLVWAPRSTATYLALRVEQEDIDLALRVPKINTEEPFEIDSTNGTRGVEPLRLVLPARSDSLVFEVVGSAPSDTRGRYRIVLEAWRSATAQDEVRARGERRFAAGEALRRRGPERSSDTLRRALAVDQEALALFRRAADTARSADVLDRLGRLHLALGDADDAVDCYREALAIFRSAGDVRAERDVQNGLGLALLARGDPNDRDAARFAFERALEISRAQREPRAEAAALANLGRLTTKSGQTRQAISTLSQALAIFRRLDERVEAAKTLGQLGRLWARVGETDRARRALETAVAQLETLGHAAEAADFLTELAPADDSPLHEASSSEQNVALLERVLALRRRLGDPRGEALALAELGRLLMRSDARRAEAHLLEALASFERLGLAGDSAATLSLLGELDARHGKFDRAISRFERAVPVLERGGDREREAWARLGWARALGARGQTRRALTLAESALDRVEALRRETQDPELRAALLASRRASSELAIDLAIDLDRREPHQGWDAYALALSERAHARSLLDLAATESPEPPLLNLAAIRRRVLAPPANTQLLEISLGRERSHAWLVSARHLDHAELPPRETIERAARRVAELLATRDRRLVARRSEEALAELSRLVLAPFVNRLDGNRLLIVPDGALHLVPWAALPNDRGRELIVDHEILLLPSASVWAADRADFEMRRDQTRSPRPPITVVADPVFAASDSRWRAARLPEARAVRGASLPRLFGTRTEAASIVALAPRGKPLVLLGFAAEKRAMKSDAITRAEILHFATHASIDPDNPRDSAIELSRFDAQGHAAEGRWTASEIERLRLSADLVVLSGCRTALGRELRGDGLLGLTQSFFRAGTPQVLVTLWSVDDRETAAFMSRFYRALWREQRSPAAALRAAQTAPDRGPTAAWAAFALEAAFAAPRERKR